MPRLGLITTGHGPRKEFINYHGNVLAALGLSDAEIVIRHALDGLTWDEMVAISAQDGEIGIGCHVNVGDEAGDRMGPGYRGVTIEREKLVPIFQQKLNELETDENVDATILCCAEEYLPGALKSVRPLVWPYLSVFRRIESLLDSMDRPLRMGLLVPSERHKPQDMLTWTSQPWMKQVDVQMALLNLDPSIDIAAQLAQELHDLDVAVIWGYSLGTAPRDPESVVMKISAALGCPVIPSRSAAILDARSLLSPPMPWEQVNGTAQ
jgi:AroM protein